MPRVTSVQSQTPPRRPSPPRQQPNRDARRRPAPLAPSAVTHPQRQVNSAQTVLGGPQKRTSGAAAAVRLPSVPAKRAARSNSKHAQDAERPAAHRGSQKNPRPQNYLSGLPSELLTELEVFLNTPSKATTPPQRRASRLSGSGIFLEEEIKAPGCAEEMPWVVNGGAKKDSASQGRQKPRAPRLKRSDAGGPGIGSTEGKELLRSEKSIKNAALARPHAQSISSETCRAPSTTWPSAEANKTADDNSSNQVSEAVFFSHPVQKRKDADVDLPYAPRDMDEEFLGNRKNWVQKKNLPGLVWSLLEGTGLEAPYTTFLWTQAYTNPASLLPDSNSVSANSDVFSHRVGCRRTGGFYACVRCGTPLCEPAHQVKPALNSLRGIAVFDALHIDGVNLRVSTPASSSHAPQLMGECRKSSLNGLNAGLDNQAWEGAADCDVFSGGLRFLVYCRHCDGCVGAIRLGEATQADFSEENTSSDLQTAPALLPTKALFCANSACLRYMPHRTRAPLDQRIVKSASFDSGAQSSGNNGGVPRTAGTLAGNPLGPRAWGPGDALHGDHRARQGLTRFSDPSYDATDDDDGDLDAEFDNLLEELKPYKTPTSVTDDDDSDS